METTHSDSSKYCQDGLQGNLVNYQEQLDSEKLIKRSRIHSFHRYFGKLIPAIPRFAIKEFTKEEDIIFDPFCGSGTTLVEAYLAGRNSYGIDLNPLSCLISNAKTNRLNIEKLNKEKEKLLKAIRNDNGNDFEKDTPFCINMKHWFQPFVIKDLAIIKRNIKNIRSVNLKIFFYTCLSAMLRDVSNADPRHIFPGYSKRLRALDKDGLRPINVLGKFESTLKNKIKYISELNGLENDGLFSKAIVGDARNIPEKVNDVQLIVTNPPYISSIRYFEVCKLEMYWLQFIAEPDEYLSLDKKGVGTERFYKNEYKTFESSGRENIDRISQRLFDAGNNKMSKVVTRFFKDMEKIFCEMHRVLRPKGYIVMKISDSLVRKELIPTHQFLIEIAKSLGFRIIDAFKDKIQNRSLLTKRNYYSGMISHDWILIFQKR